MQQPRSEDIFGWLTWPNVPISDKNSFSFLSSFDDFVSLFTAIATPFPNTPLYTSAYPPFPTKLSADQFHKIISLPTHTICNYTCKEAEKYLSQNHWLLWRFHQSKSSSKCTFEIEKALSRTNLYLSHHSCFFDHWQDKLLRILFHQSFCVAWYGRVS